MAVTPASGGSFSEESALDIQKAMQQMRAEYHRISQDLGAGNLSAAQEDFATLQSLAPQNSAGSSLQSSQLIAQAFEQLSHELKPQETPQPQEPPQRQGDSESAAAKGNLSSTAFDA